MIARRVYRVCVVSIGSKDTVVDLFKLDTVNFNIILGMYWLHSCYDSLDCQTHRVLKN